MFEIYKFGKFIKTSSPLSVKDVRQVLKDAETARQKLRRISIHEIISVLSKAGKNWARPDYHLRIKAQKIMPGIVGFSPRMVKIALDALSAILDESYLKKKIQLEIGNLSYLDSWAYNVFFKRYLKAESLGIVLHVVPGNVFIGGIDSLIAGLITKNINILKTSAADPVFPLLFIQSLKEADMRGIVSKSMAVLPFKGGNAEVESEFKKSCNGIIVWGAEEAVRSWRKDLGVSTKLIEYGPRVSFAVITKKGQSIYPLDETARKIALDIVMWEQRACSSPQIIYVEKDKILNNLFLRSLEKALKYYAKNLPPGKLSDDEKAEITKFREMAKMDEVFQEGRLIHSKKDTSWTIIYKENPEFEFSCLNRTILVKAYKNLGELYERLKPFSSYFQSTVLLGTSQEIYEISDSLVSIGVTRVVQPGGLNDSPAGEPHEGAYQAERLVKWAVLDEALKKPDVFISLKNIVDFAKKNSPLYKKLYKNIEIKKQEDFKKLPLIDKEIFCKNTPPRSNNLLGAPLESSYIFSSGGTSGQPKFAMYTYGEFEDVKRDLSFAFKAAGLKKGDIAANLFMAGNLWASFLIVNKVLEDIGCITLPIGGGADTDLILKYIKLFKPNVWLGIPSVIIQLAQEVEKKKLNIEIEKIFYAGEHLSPEAQKYLKKILRTKKIVSAGYASVDAGTIGYQCEYTQGVIHHLLSDSAYLEIINPVAEKIVPEGSSGEIVVTNLKRKLMPLIRYRTGDMGRIVKGECRCSKDAVSFELLGRCDDFLRLGTVNLYPGKFEKIISGFKQLSPLFQITGEKFKTKDIFTLKIELKEKGKDPQKIEEKIKKAILEKDEELREAVQKGWLYDFKVRLLNPGEIPRIARTGKIKRVLDLRQGRQLNGGLH